MIKVSMILFLFMVVTTLGGQKIPQKPNQLKAINAAAGASNSVPDLKVTVQDLADEVEAIKKDLESKLK